MKLGWLARGRRPHQGVAWSRSSTSRRARHRLSALAAAALIGLSGALLPVRPAQAHHQSLAWSAGGPFPTFGPNEIVEIIGGFHPYYTCELKGGKNDYAPVLVVRSDIYVVPAGSVSGAGGLRDVNGAPNHYELLGALPSGSRSA